MIPLQTHFPTYISTRHPTKYGGPQEGYKARSQEAITYGIEQVKNTEKNQERLETLFRDLCTEFGHRRKEIAIEQGTENAQRFGQPRIAAMAYTPLQREGEYSDYNDRILRLVQTELNRLEHTKKAFLKKTFRKEEQAFGRSSVFEGEIITAETLKERKYDCLPSLEELQALDWGNVDITGQSTTQIIDNDDAMRRLKKVAPKLYERMKMAIMGFELSQKFPSPKKLIFPLGTISLREIHKT